MRTSLARVERAARWGIAALAMASAHVWAAPTSATVATRIDPIQSAKAEALAMPPWQRRDQIMDCVKDFDGETYRFEMGARCKGLWQASLETDFNGNFHDLDRWLKARAAVEAPVREAQREM